MRLSNEANLLHSSLYMYYRVSSFSACFSSLPLRLVLFWRSAQLEAQVSIWMIIMLPTVLVRTKLKALPFLKKFIVSYAVSVSLFGLNMLMPWPIKAFQG
ncbi:hypothetical protein SAY86_003074 [Trapa natans]|uniref:Uncharacterized protein n=1 Tax=Trapa natans TaxID=22666 RepID=A0AAN7LS04_TRANT|nr:hypothetical protein SAY86_003074 [Trapa natans]